MNNFEEIFSLSKIMFIIVPVIIFIGVVFTILMLVSPKFRGKIMSKQIKAMKHMTDYSKEDMEDIGKNLGEVVVNTKKGILDKNEKTLTDISTNEANIKAPALKKITRAIKEGLVENTVYCKYCGEEIDSDSVYCNKCGKKQ